MGIRPFHTTAVLLTLGVDGGLPNQFRLFSKGWNSSEKGRVLFDDAAAQSVMDAYRKWGVDLAIDLEHQMLSGASPDPTARDARGWCKLELRPDGSLWAVDVKWTSDGAERLSEKRQRYVSPAFERDLKTGRVEKILNIAITAMPATHNAPALVAASASGGCMDPKLVAQALDAVEKGDAKAALDLLKQLIASAAGADPDAATEDAPPPAGDGGADETTESAAPPPAPPGDAPPPDDKKKEAVAATARIVRLSGADTITAALDVVETWRKSHIALESERQTLATERATLESAERRDGCARLVKFAGRAPATVWADAACSAPKKYLAAMSLADFREYVADAIKSVPARGTAPVVVHAPADGQTFNVDGKTVMLDARELAICAESKCEPATFAMLKARRTTAA